MTAHLRDTFMNIRWPEDRELVKDIEAELSRRCLITPLKGRPRFVAGVDAAFPDGSIVAAVCLYTYPALKFIEEAWVVRPLRFPYIPGLLSFREGPAVIEAIESLKTRPDLIICDGQGIAHPRGLGLASTVGIILDIPAVGSAKSRLTGQAREPAWKRGSRRLLKINGRKAGALVRTRDGKRPLCVSPGHRIDIEGAVRVVLRCTRGYRVTEPVRCADRLAGRIKRRLLEEGGAPGRAAGHGKKERRFYEAAPFER